MTSFIFDNFYQTTLSSALTSSGTTLNVASATGAPTISAGQQWAVVLQSANTSSIREVVYVVGISGNTFTVIRAQEGTTALSWAIGDDLISCNTAGIMGAFPQEATNNTWTGKNAFSGAVTVGTASSGSNPVPLSQAQADFAALNGSASEAFSMTTAAVGTNTTQGATTAFVQSIPHGSQLFTASGTFTVPAGVTLVEVETLGGGGSGSGVGGGGSAAAGGGSGGYSKGRFAVTPGAVITVTVGAGGAAAGSGGGNPGGTSSFGSFNSATGGLGGGAAGNQGGLGGVGSGSGAVNGTGAPGSPGVTGLSGALLGGTGGSSLYGGGGLESPGAGIAATGYGAGGGGAGGAGAADGGAGTAGLVYVRW